MENDQTTDNTSQLPVKVQDAGVDTYTLKYPYMMRRAINASHPRDK